jgi:hypothetical protein
MATNVRITGIAQTIRQVETDFNKHVASVADQLQTEAKSFTPVRTGRAQAGWKKFDREGNFEVYNTVPYIDYLDRGTKKMPAANRGLGIVQPAIQSTKRKMK